MAPSYRQAVFADCDCDFCCVGVILIVYCKRERGEGRRGDTGGGGEERETDRQTDRQTDRHRHRQTQTDRQTDTDRETDGQTEMDRQRVL